MLHFHLDTDFGGNPDDFAALLMLLGMPDVRLTGITTVLDDAGFRAGAVRQVLEHVGRADIPLCAGARNTLSSSEPLEFRTDFWSDVTPLPASEPGQSITVIERSMWMRSVFTLIGPYTNGAMFERVRGGLLRERRVVHMGGHIQPPADGYPQFTAGDDTNVRLDIRATQELYGSFADITMVPKSAAVNAWVTESDVDQIGRTGPLGEKLASQMRAWEKEKNWQETGKKHDRLPDDLVGIMWDPVTALIATGWEGAKTETISLTPVIEADTLTFIRDEEHGRPVDVVTSIDGPAFREVFITALTDAQKTIR